MIKESTLFISLIIVLIGARCNQTYGTPLLDPLCETFEEGYFPPTGWSVLYTGTNYWLYANVSGHGNGAHSAEYDMTGSANQTLQTLTFQPSLPNQALAFLIAYDPYPASPPYSHDSLVILISTDGGSSYNVLVRMGPLQMQSAPPSNNTFFVPAPSEWINMSLALPVGTNSIRFECNGGGSPHPLYLDSTCIGTPVGITNIHTGVPNSYSLHQNYPNPFNPTTTIKFDIPKDANVTFEIYDVLGRLVATLANNEFKKADEYEVTWDAAKFASGVYFYRITANDFVDTKKMVLLK